jgi:hypothetical protein
MLISIDGSILQCYEFQRPIKCLQLDPKFSKTGRFIAGGHAGEVVLYEKSWRGSQKVVLARVSDTIVALSWRSHWLAYASESVWMFESP